MTSKAYRFLNLKTLALYTIVEFTNVEFFEDAFPFKKNLEIVGGMNIPHEKGIYPLKMYN